LRAALSDDLAVRLHYLSLPAAFAGLLWYTRRQYFTEDDWEFIHRLIPGAGHLGLFAPHNEHWSTLPLLVYKVLFALVGVRSYVPYMAVLLALHVLAAHLLWRIMRRAGAEAWLATVITAIFLVLGTGAENITWAFQIGFVGALAAGLGMILVALVDSPRRLAAAWVLGVSSVMCSGLGPVMVALAALTVLLRSGWRRALLIVSVPAIVYTGWLLIVGLHSTGTSLPRGPLSEVPDYMFTGITSAAAAVTGLRFVGALLLIPLGWWLLVRARRPGDQAAVVALAAGTVLFFFVVGVGRVSLGVMESTTARYVYISAVLLLPAAAVAASALTRRHVVVAAVVALALTWSAVHNVRALNLAVQGVTGVRQHAEARIIAAANLVDAPVTTFGGPPEPATAPDLSWTDLVYLVENHDLPAQGPFAPDTFDVVSVAANLQMTASVTPLLPSGGTSIHAVGAVSLVPASPGCVAATGRPPSVQLVFSRAAAVLIHVSAGSVITAHLRASPSSRIDSFPHQYIADPAGDLYLDVALAGAAPVLDLPPAGAVLCGISP
jgi:hypothetical protein